MKIKEIVDLSKKELEEKLENMQEELFNLRFQSTMGQLTNPVRMRYIRKDIARIKTVLNAKSAQ